MSPSPKEPSVFPVAPAKVFPAGHKPGVPDGLLDRPVSTPDTETPSARDVIANVLRCEDPDGLLGFGYQATCVLKALSDAGYTVARLEQVGNASVNVPWVMSSAKGKLTMPWKKMYRQNNGRMDALYRIVGSSE